MFRDAEGVLRILLLLRTDRGVHGGQLGLPGGRPEPGDGGFLATALREAEEEVGLPPAQVEVLAALDPLETLATGWRVHPFLGRVPADVEWRPQPDEVVRVLTPSVEALGDPASAGACRSPRATSGSRSRSRGSTSRATCCGA